ncbi:MAG: hypothetical protein GY891_00995 [Bacteroidetes bacterium]|nr:hypothetical protein [Bacteroidota bacterium]
MENNNNNIHVVNLSNYTAPKIEEVRGQEYVEYGSDNNYFQYLIDRYTGSTTNNAIINGISRQIYGKGISALDSNRRPEQYAQMLSLFSKDDLKRFITDRKMLGMSAFQVTYEKGLVKKVTHFPMNTLRAEKMNEEGRVEAWYYHPNWEEVKPSDEPLRINAFGFGNKKGNEIYVLQPYIAGYYYYSPVDYVGALPYAVLEEEIGDYLINDTINGFSGSKVVNFNNGIPDQEAQFRIKNDVVRKLTGARGEKVIVAFNDNAESATTVEDLPLNDAPDHYSYLSEECRNKLIVGHSVTSPMLIGVRESGGGLGNNADEIKTASLLFDNTTIKPKQDEVIDVMNEILAVNDISLKLYFKTIQPLEFIDTDGLDAETKEEETGVKMSAEDVLDFFGEEENLDEWELIDESKVDYDTEVDLDAKINELNNPKLSILAKIKQVFTSTGTARPNAKSKQDGEAQDYKYKVRYQYAGNKNPQRGFCKKMMSAKKIYRKEDIQMMSKKPVNKGWGANGADTYDIWLYKGGGDCHHYWMRKTYRAKNTTPDAKNPRSEVSVNKAKKDGFKPTVNDSKVAKLPTDMENRGFLPTNKRFQ